MEYERRLVDDELDAFFPHLAAIALEGPKGVGKTATAAQRAATVIRLDDARDRKILEADIDRVDRLPAPVLFDEWQRSPSVWDRVRRSVDEDNTGGRFLFTGSAAPRIRPAHSGAGRIVRLRMRPLSLAERRLTQPTVSLGELLLGGRHDIGGSSSVNLEGYVEEIVASGFPGIRSLPSRVRNAQLDSYLSRLTDVELLDEGYRVARPDALRRWMTAYAAATSSTASYNSILDAATPGESEKPTKKSTQRYRDALTQLFIVDSISGWLPALNPLSRLAQSPKHHLADPALAARLVGVSAQRLLVGYSNSESSVAEPFIGPLFESLVTQSVRTYAQWNTSTVHHLRTQNGNHEIDLIVEGEDRRVVALEVKLGAVVGDADVRHLLWLREQIGAQLADAAVITTGGEAYRRKDGIAVIPAALLSV
jgi:uncharacterized protein